MYKWWVLNMYTHRNKNYIFKSKVRSHFTCIKKGPSRKYSDISLFLISAREVDRGHIQW